MFAEGKQRLLRLHQDELQEGLRQFVVLRGALDFGHGAITEQKGKAGKKKEGGTNIQPPTLNAKHSTARRGVD
jgi:hypothetical protein